MCGGCYAVESLRVLMSQTQATRKQGRMYIAQQIVCACGLMRHGPSRGTFAPPNNGWRGSRVSNFARYLGSDLAGCCGCSWQVVVAVVVGGGLGRFRNRMFFDGF